MTEKPPTPVLMCQPREDFEGGLKFYCQYCKRWHYHGIGEGHRVAHCIRIDSPYNETGYILRLEKQRRRHNDRC